MAGRRGVLHEVRVVVVEERTTCVAGVGRDLLLTMIGNAPAMMMSASTKKKKLPRLAESQWGMCARVVTASALHVCVVISQPSKGGYSEVVSCSVGHLVSTFGGVKRAM
jgi:hypothetical protein